MTKKTFSEPNTVRDEDAVVRVMTDKGPVCMTAEQHDTYSASHEKNSAPAWRFGVVANITHSHLDENGVIRYGTKAFTPGTKVYLGGKNRSWENVEIGVIGRNRFGRIVVEAVPISLLENVRTQRIYKPKVLKIMEYLEVLDGWAWWERTAADRKETELFVKEWRSR